MALNQRQKRFYTDICDIYNPLDPASTPRLPNNDVQGLHYPQTPTYSDQKCYRQTAAEVEKGKFFGRFNREDTPSLLDRIHVDDALVIHANAMFYLKTPNDSDYQTWYIAVGDNMAKNNLIGNKQVYFIKKTIKPPGVA